MLDGSTPKWLTLLERRMGWLAIPNIAILFITLQVLGFFMVSSNPAWYAQLALLPQTVLQANEWWRLVTFLALPLSMSPFWMIFVLWFLYFILNSLENEWGAFKTTFYILTSLSLTILYSFIFGYPIGQVQHFESTLFLAAAALFPEMEIRLFLIFPVKLKWLAWLTLAFVAWQVFQGDWYDRGHLFAIYPNYLVFFGPAFWGRLKAAQRRRNYLNKLK